MHRRQRHIFQYVQMIKQIEMLENHTDIFPHLIDVRALISHVIAVDHNLPGSGFLQLVQAPQKRGFSTAGGPDQHNNLALCHFQTDILKHLKRTEILF